MRSSGKRVPVAARSLKLSLASTGLLFQNTAVVKRPLVAVSTLIAWVRSLSYLLHSRLSCSRKQNQNRLLLRISITWLYLATRSPNRNGILATCYDCPSSNYSFKMHKPSIAQIVYNTTFPRPKPADPPSFSVHITRNLVPEVRVETAAFYGSLDSIEAQYPGLDYSWLRSAAAGRSPAAGVWGLWRARFDQAGDTGALSLGRNVISSREIRKRRRHQSTRHDRG